MREYRVQISFYKREPYLQSADLAIGSRLAVVLEKTKEYWLLRDDNGQEHTIATSSMEEPGKRPEQGRWVVAQPRPTYWIGEELTLSWLMRNRSMHVEKRDDFTARVSAEDGESVSVLGPQGHEHVICRANGHESERIVDGERVFILRQEPRWVIVARSE